MSTPVQIPLGGFTKAAADDLAAGDYLLHSLSTSTSINGSIAGRRVLTYTGGALAIVLTAPVAGQDDGKRIGILNITSQAHTVTCTGHLFDGNNHQNELTFSAHPGGYAEIEAYQGSWYCRTLQQVTGS